jgi:hypothetical protein
VLYNVSPPTISRIHHQLAIGRGGKQEAVGPWKNQHWLDCCAAQSPDGDAKLWWSKLKDALGTNSSAFVDASYQEGPVVHCQHYRGRAR